MRLSTPVGRCLGGIALFALALGFLPAPADARDPDSRTGVPADTLPRFDDYPAEPVDKAPAEIDFENSIEQAWMFRTTLRNAAPEGPNFAGHWTIVTVGCGTSCQISFIIDTLSGRVYDAPQSTLGVLHRTDSRLLIVNDPELSDPDGPAYYLPQYWVLDGTEFRQIAGPVFD